MRFSVLGPLAVVDDLGVRVAVGGSKRRDLLLRLLIDANRVVPTAVLIEDLWRGDPPAGAEATLQSHVSHLRKPLGARRLVGDSGGYRLVADRRELVAAVFEDQLGEGRRLLESGQAAAAEPVLAEALAQWHGSALSEVADAEWAQHEAVRLEDLRLLATELLLDAQLELGRHGEVSTRAEMMVALHPLRERLWALLMTALYRDGRQADALRAYGRLRSLLVEELGIEPSAELRQLERHILAQDPTIGAHVRPSVPDGTHDLLPSGVVTFLLTDIVGSSGLWERQPLAMAEALARHDALVAEQASAHGGQRLKAKLEGDATMSVFARATSGAIAALALRDALAAEPWPRGAAPQVRMAVHTGEAFERDGDYFGPALNRAARLRSLATGGQILVSQAVAELVRDHLPDDVVLRSLGQRALRGLSRAEHVYELVSSADPDSTSPTSAAELAAITVPPIPFPLTGAGPFVGREAELAMMTTDWHHALDGSPRAVLVGGEPGVGKTRLAAEHAQRLHADGTIVLYGRCDEDLGAPYQPFTEALRSLLPCVGSERLATMRGVEELTRLVPELADLWSQVSAPVLGDPDAERYALFDAVTRLLDAVAADAPLLIVLDDLHWASKPTLLLLRHVLRSAEHARIEIVATYRTTDLDPAHPLAAMLADLQRDRTSQRLVLVGLDADEVAAFLDATGHDDIDLARTLSSVTSGNPFFLIEVLRHVEENGGTWDPTTLPQGVREAVGRRLARMTPDANEALVVGAVVGARFSLTLVEQVLDRDLVDAVGEACEAGILVEEAHGWFGFNHAIVRRSMLAGLASVKRVRLHQRIAEQLEARAGRDDELLADLAHHFFESAWAGNATKAVEYCRRAADQAMARLAFEGAADLYDRALQAGDIEESAQQPGEREGLLIAWCEALLAAGDVIAAAAVVARLEGVSHGSPRVAAWATCFTGQIAALSHPDQLDTIERALGAAAKQFANLDDTAGEAKAHTVRASCLARLGRVGDCEAALDQALTVARRVDDERGVNAALAGAPLAALWGPSPVPRASGRCLDVLRALRITNGSPLVEATSLRCQAVLESFRSRPPAARRLIDTARDMLSDLGLRHAVLEVDLYAGIVELVAGDLAAAQTCLSRAYLGFRRAGVDADAAQAAAFLARVHLEMGQVADAESMCVESERLAGHDLKASIAWRAVSARLLSQRARHTDALALAEAAVALAASTDALVDHGDACLALASVLRAAGRADQAAAAASAAVELFERKGAVALVQRARDFSGLATTLPSLGGSGVTAVRDDREPPMALDASSDCVDLAGRSVLDAADQGSEVSRVIARMLDSCNRRDWAMFRACLDDHLVVVDHRPLGWGMASAGDLIESLVAMAELAPDHMLIGGRLHAERAGVAALHNYQEATNISGGFTESHSESVVVASGGRLTRLGVSPEGNLGEVLARFEALAAAALARTGQSQTERTTDNAMLELVASRSDRFELLRSRRVDDAGAVVGFDGFLVRETDSGGDVVSQTWFESGDLDGAQQALEARYAAPGSPSALARLTTAFNRRDWEAFRATWSDDAIGLNHRLAVWGSVGGTDAMLDQALTLTELIPDAMLLVTHLLHDADGVAAVHVSVLGTNSVGGDVEIDLHVVFVEEAGRLVWREDFDGNDPTAALDRARALRAERAAISTRLPAPPPQHMADGFKQLELLASRGERLALFRMDTSSASDDAAATEQLLVREVDDDGDVVWQARYQWAELGAAYEMLELRHAAAGVASPALQFTAAFNRRDWAAFADLMHENVVTVDHRSASWGTVDGRDALVALASSLPDIAPDVVMIITKIHSDDRGVTVLNSRAFGSNSTGGPIETNVNLVYVLTDGRLIRSEFFATEQLDAALDRAEALRTARA